jgi:hypothetical protein
MSLHNVPKYPVVDIDPSLGRVFSNLTTGEIISIPTYGFLFGSVGFFSGNWPISHIRISLVNVLDVSIVMKNVSMTYQPIV